MFQEPHCPLCSADLVKETDVWTQRSGQMAPSYAQAWVCKNCGTAWPIGLKGGSALRPKAWKAIWAKGKRYK